VFHENMTRIIGTLHEGQYTFLIMSRPVLLRMRNVSDESCKRIQNTHFMLNNFSKCRAFYEIRYENNVVLDKAHMAIWSRSMRIACWITKGARAHTHTHTHTHILISFPLQQWLHERTSLLRYSYAFCHVITEMKCLYSSLMPLPGPLS